MLILGLLGNALDLLLGLLCHRPGLVHKIVSRLAHEFVPLLRLGQDQPSGRSKRDQCPTAGQWVLLENPPDLTLRPLRLLLGPMSYLPSLLLSLVADLPSPVLRLAGRCANPALGLLESLPAR